MVCFNMLLTYHHCILAFNLTQHQDAENHMSLGGHQTTSYKKFSFKEVVAKVGERIFGFIEIPQNIIYDTTSVSVYDLFFLCGVSSRDKICACSMRASSMPHIDTTFIVHIRNTIMYTHTK